jgi:hypothetical protein
MRKITRAATVTTSKFGPSGSLNKANIILEPMRAVRAKMSKETFFDGVFM